MSASCSSFPAATPSAGSPGLRCPIASCTCIPRRAGPSSAGRRSATRSSSIACPPRASASRWTFKCWPAERNAQLVDRLSAEGERVVLTAAPGESAFIDEILSRTAAKPLNLAGQLTLKELGALTARARLFIGVDSMPMHLAAAMGTPTVALFGPSSEEEWAPWKVEQRLITSSHSCRPCRVDGCGGCKVSECLTLLPVDAVYAAARELLARAA